MKILATAFLALVFWIGWIIASLQFGVANGINNSGFTCCRIHRI